MSNTFPKIGFVNLKRVSERDLEVSFSLENFSKLTHEDNSTVGPFELTFERISSLDTSLLSVSYTFDENGVLHSMTLYGKNERLTRDTTTVSGGDPRERRVSCTYQHRNDLLVVSLQNLSKHRLEEIYRFLVDIHENQKSTRS